jgi:hypothetical protein
MGMNTHASARVGTEINLASDTDIEGHAIWVGTAGDITVDMTGGSEEVPFKNVPVGWFACQHTKIYSTANGTTAADLVSVKY